MLNRPAFNNVIFLLKNKDVQLLCTHHFDGRWVCQLSSKAEWVMTKRYFMSDVTKLKVAQWGDFQRAWHDFRKCSWTSVT